MEKKRWSEFTGQELQKLSPKEYSELDSRECALEVQDALEAAVQIMWRREGAGSGTPNSQEHIIPFVIEMLLLAIQQERESYE